MSMLNQLPSSRNNSLNHLLDWEKVLDQCKTHQDNYYDKDSKCNLPECYQDFPTFGLVTYFEYGVDIINTNILTKVSIC